MIVLSDLGLIRSRYGRQFKKFGCKGRKASTFHACVMAARLADTCLYEKRTLGHWLRKPLRGGRFLPPDLMFSIGGFTLVVLREFDGADSGCWPRTGCRRLKLALKLAEASTVSVVQWIVLLLLAAALLPAACAPGCSAGRCCWRWPCVLPWSWA